MRDVNPRAISSPQNFLGCDRNAIATQLASVGWSSVHAQNLFRDIYRRSPPRITGEGSRYPRPLPGWFQRNFHTSLPRIERTFQSRYDNSVKFVLTLDDDQRIEMVLMPEKGRLTACLSTQVGCAQGCIFCHTGRMGLRRQLQTCEIVGQYLTARNWIAQNSEWLTGCGSISGEITNIVFMGMGEPLDNTEALIPAIRIFCDPYGLGLGMKRISVSTAGHLPGLMRILEVLPRVRIALSVHNCNDSARSRIMPINRRWPLADVIQTLGQHARETRISPLLQYTLIGGVNDDLQDADALAELSQRSLAKVNLIPFNEIAPSRLQAPEPEKIQSFRDRLHRQGVRTMVRYSKGQDIAAACGQLVCRSVP